MLAPTNLPNFGAGQGASIDFPGTSAQSELRLTCWGDSGVIVTAYITYMLPSGAIINTTLTNTCTGIISPGNTTIIDRFPQCTILNISILSNTIRGAAYAGMYLYTNGKVMPLIYGYVTNAGGLTYPLPSKENFDLGLAHRLITSPGAGANLGLGPFDSECWNNWNLKFRLVTSATAANRYVQLDINDGIDGLIFRANAPVVQQASLTYDYIFGNFGVAALNNGAAPPLLANGTTVICPLPLIPFSSTFYVGVGLEGRNITSSITNLQAGDQISQIVLTGKRSITGN